MASFFKGSCVVYWLCWLGCLAYFFGTFIYTSTYIMPTKANEAVAGTVKFLCIFNVFTAFFGCVFVKCSITHVLCAALYIMPVLGVNAAFCILGVLEVRKLTPPTPQDLIDDVMKTLRRTKFLYYPHWLTNVQKQLPCCGVYSYLDFPLTFRNETKLSGVIPRSCCHTNMSTASGCNSKLDHYNMTKTVMEILNNINSSKMCSEQPRFNYTGQYQMRFAPADDLSTKIFLCGCYNDINRLAASLYQAHFIFFLVLLAAAIIMAVVYIKVWCKHRGSNADSGSDHSLDVDDVSSIHSIKPDEAPVTDLGHQHSNLDIAGKPSSTYRTRIGSLTDPSTAVVGAGSKIVKPKPGIPNLRKAASVLPMHPPKK